MNLLVTGAMGHVGYEIAKQAVARGMRVIASHAGTFRAADAEALGSAVSWIAGDLSDQAAVEAIAARHGVDACIHAAAISNEAYAKPEPLKAIGANVMGTANLLDAARRHAWRRFVLVSTGSVFQIGVDPVKPIFEDHPPSPSNVYGTTKRAAEMLTSMFRNTYGLSAATVRISWVFGAPLITDSPTRGPIPSFLGRALRGEAIREGGADFAASFTYVADVAEGLIEAARAPTLHHDIYHLGSGVNFTTGQVADAVRSAVPGAVIDLGPGTLPWTTYTSPRGPLAGDRFKQDTGYTVRHSLDAAIAAYATWMRSAQRG